MTKTMTPEKVFAKVQREAEKIASGKPQTIGTVSPGDVIRQGDLMLVALGQVKITGDEIADRQLAPGSTQGSRHVLTGDVTVYRADASTISATCNSLVRGAAVPAELIGPVFRVNGPAVLEHPEHGHFELTVGETFAVVYQRALADEIRRQQD